MYMQAHSFELIACMHACRCMHAAAFLRNWSKAGLHLPACLPRYLIRISHHSFSSKRSLDSVLYACNKSKSSRASLYFITLRLIFDESTHVIKSSMLRVTWNAGSVTTSGPAQEYGHIKHRVSTGGEGAMGVCSCVGELQRGLVGSIRIWVFHIDMASHTQATRKGSSSPLSNSTV